MADTDIKDRDAFTEKDLALLRKCLEASNGESWAPRDPGNPFFDRAVKAGYVVRRDGICIFERIRNAVIAWTEAGVEACRAGVDPVAPHAASATEGSRIEDPTVPDAAPAPGVN